MELPRGAGILLIETLYHQGGIFYIGGRFPSALVLFVTLPVD